MINKFLVCLFVCVSFRALSCDVCGASNSIAGFGPYANGNRTYFGINYQYKTYKSQHPAFFNEAAEKSTELFQRIELRSQIRIASRWQISVAIPLTINQQQKNGSKNQITGFADATLGINYFLFNRKDSLTGNTFRWNIGLGGKLPTGRYTHPDSSDLMLYGGSGSVDGYLTNALFYKINKWAFVSESSLFIRGVNKFNYHAGNTTTTTLMANRKLRDFSVFGGFQYVWVGQAYKNRALVADSPTTGSILTNLWGITYQKSNLMFQGSYHIPLAQHLGNGYTKQKQAFSISLFYFL